MKVLNMTFFPITLSIVIHDAYKNHTNNGLNGAAFS